MSAYLGRYRGDSRLHTESDLRVFLTWCTDQDLDPLSAARVDIERYVRWLQDVRRFQPSTVSRRLSVVVGFYRVWSSTASCRTHQPTTSGDRSCHPNHPPSGWDTSSSKP
ncbi:site-specific integrase [Micromonospora sp. ATA32]|nr:site-specific integrase [Micromonospora sp. ATA32]